MNPDDLPRKVDAIRDVLANLQKADRPIDALSDDRRIAVLHRVADGLDAFAAFAGVPNHSKKNTQELRLISCGTADQCRVGPDPRTTQGAAMSYVCVERSPFGTTAFQDAVMDIFEKDTLTITCTDPTVYEGQPIQVFAPSRWRSATMFDARGNVLAAFVNSQEQHDRDAAYAAAKGRVS